MNNSDEINLNQILQIFTARWKYLVTLALLFTLCALIKHKYFPSYSGAGKIIIKDISNNQLQSIIGHVAGVGGEMKISDLKGSGQIERAEALLDVHEFYVNVANRLLEIKNAKHNFFLSDFFSSFEKNENDPEYIHDVANKLANLITFNSRKADVLIVDVKTSNRFFTVVLTNVVLREAQKNLIDRELSELNRAEDYFNQEIRSVRGRINNIENVTASKLKAGQKFSIDMERGESLKYIGELRKNINNLKMAISNNESKISELKRNVKIYIAKNETGTISKFTEATQVKFLEDESNDLRLELKTYESYLKNFEQQKNSAVPFQYEMEKMNVNHEFEYKMYSSLNDSLARLGLQKTYVKNKIEVLEFERISRVHSNPHLLLLILAALTLSQITGIFGIYLYELFKPHELVFKY